VDIVRSAETGTYYVLETNPQSGNWSLTNPDTGRIAQNSGIDLYAQFGALDVVAETAAEAAMKLAR
jgi:hypothetical protein